MIPRSAMLLRIFIGESDTWQGQPLYRAIVLKARALGLAGATVLKGPMGFGANSLVHTTNLLELSTDLPIVVEIVDVAEHVGTMRLRRVAAEAEDGHEATIGLAAAAKLRVLDGRADQALFHRVPERARLAAIG